MYQVSVHQRIMIFPGQSMLPGWGAEKKAAARVVGLGAVTRKPWALDYSVPRSAKSCT